MEPGCGEGHSSFAVILRHPRERLSKCSLHGLETHPRLCIRTYLRDPTPDLTGRVCLTMNAPLLSPGDADRGLFLIDGTWRLAERMARGLEVVLAPLTMRSLPAELRSAYPRTQTGCPDPVRGLATVEALYASFLLTGTDPAGLLDHYRWKEEFLEMNAGIFREISPPVAS